MSFVNVLKEVKENRIGKLSEDAWDIIVHELSNENYSIKNDKKNSFLEINDVLIAKILNTKIKFLGNLKFYYGDEESKYIKNFLINSLKNKNLGSNNNGHKFERMTAYILKELGHRVEGIEITNEFPVINKELKEVLQDLPKENLTKIKDIKNAESISGDFIGNNLSISCKYNNKILKHPSLMTVFALSCNKKRDKFIKLIKFLSTDKLFTKELARLEFGKESSLSKKLIKEVFPLLIKFHDKKNTAMIYDFLIGKDRPTIITMKKNNSLDVKNTKEWKNPTNYKWEEVNNKIIIHFNNGVSLAHRIKIAINNETKTKLCNVYKEEWKLIHYPK